MNTHGLNQEQSRLAAKELQKAFVLCSEGVDIQMFSTGIDALWHQMLTDEGGYHDFCESSVGEKVNHIPNKGHGNISFIPEYEKKYGDLDSIWFVDVNGEINKEQLSEYRNTGALIASWDCTPAMEKMRKAPPPNSDKSVKKDKDKSEDVQKKEEKKQKSK